MRVELDRVNREALQEIEDKMAEIQREEKRMKEQIEISKERFKMKEELAQAEARIEVCTRYENEENALRVIDEAYSSEGNDRIQEFLESQPDPITTIEIEPKSTAPPRNTEPPPPSTMVGENTEEHHNLFSFFGQAYFRLQDGCFLLQILSSLTIG